MNDFGCLRPMRDDDLARVLVWRNAPGVRRNMYTRHEITAEEHAAWWAATTQRDDRAYFIYEQATTPLGVVGFTQIDRANGNAAWAFYADPEAPRGTGSRMEFLALDHAFGAIEKALDAFPEADAGLAAGPGGLGLHKLWCEVLAFNRPVLGLHTKFGFAEEGIFRQHIRMDDEYVDIHRLAILADDWNSRRAAMRTRLTNRTDR